MSVFLSVLLLMINFASKRKQTQWLIKILGRQTKNVMVFSELANAERFECDQSVRVACPQFSVIWKPPYHLHEVYIYK